VLRHKSELQNSDWYNGTIFSRTKLVKSQISNPKFQINPNTRRTRLASAGAAGAPALRVTKIQNLKRFEH